MKSLLILLAAAAFVSAAVIGFAQSQGASANPSPAAGSPPPDAAAPSSSTGSAGPSASSVPLPAAPAPSAQPGGPMLENNMPLIPETLPGGKGEGGKGGNEGKQGRSGRAHGGASPGASPHGTFQVEEAIQTRIRVREAETKVENEPGMQAEWAAAHATLTDPERRTALIAYYNHLYDRMIKMDPTISTNVNIRREAVIARMHYARLGDLLPAQDPYATPVPAAEGPNPPSTDPGSL